ncbi:RTA1 domain-containing protein [Aspergillus affinis]|uniref:RTA1 domain-containing protein n=1 Tax=Aspergillus affinis TaxID=1070780 RepID=UPI0022FF438D|nr:RTA1 like protein [Aspergillus affinis]KAI9045569.1 RTA1 like protein [Aspergillus affinis]
MADASNEEYVTFSFYHYDPTKAGAIVFILLFIATTAMHTFQMIKTRTWFFMPFVIGGFFEWIGYIGRAMSSDETPNWTLGPYLLQTLLLLLAPALFAASIYMLMGRIILVLQAESHAMLKKKWLTKIFVTGDVLSFLLQSAGGGIQASGSLNGMKTGEKVIIVGLFVQLAFFGFFIFVAFSFDMKLKNYPIPRCFASDIPWRKHLNVLYVSSALIMVRSVFRVIEYIQGNSGYLLQHEAYMYIFDACLMFLTMVIFNVVHPSEIGKLLDGMSKDTEYMGTPMV